METIFTVNKELLTYETCRGIVTESAAWKVVEKIVGDSDPDPDEIGTFDTEKEACDFATRQPVDYSVVKLFNRGYHYECKAYTVMKRFLDDDGEEIDAEYIDTILPPKEQVFRGLFGDEFDDKEKGEE